jgi:O-antigen ligase
VFLHLETVEETRRPVVEDNVTRPAPVGIHNTGLWLLVETGVIGALVFIAFFAAIAFALWRACRAEGANGAALLALLALAGFVGVSVGMEAMYNRTLWLLLGMGLALPEAARLGAFSKLATPTRKAGALGGIRTGTPAERLGLRQAKGTGPSS